MASEVSVQIIKGSGNVAECEVAGGSIATLSAGTKDWKAAASELLLSEAARENPVRYFRVAQVLLTGNEEGFRR